jgi:hypothetical protein
MAQYAFVSAKVVLARVIRALGYKLPSVYHDDILEWIPEGMGLLNCTNGLVLMETGDKDCPGEVLVKNHCTHLPKGFVNMEGVYSEHGVRLTPGNGATRDAERYDARPNVWQTDPYLYNTSAATPDIAPESVIPRQGMDLRPYESTSDPGSYIIKGNNIQTSQICDGYIKVKYYSTALCGDGYPMIPDNENFKQALEWHIIRRLIGSGYVHAVFTYLQTDELFERSAARAIAEISYPSPDKMARTSRTLTRLIPPDNFIADYFINS